MAIRKMTREEYEKEFGAKPNNAFTPTSTTDKKNDGNFLTGLGKSALSTAKGLLKVGEAGGNLILPKKVEPRGFVESLEKTKLGQKYFTDEALKTRGLGEKAGKFAGDVAQFAIPGAKVSKLTQALPTVSKLGARAVASGAIATAQSGKLGKESAIAAGAEIVAPGVGKVVSKAAKPVTNLLGRLLRGTASGLSGASSSQIRAVLDDPKAAKTFVKEIKNAGGAELLRKESKAIVQGVSQIKKEARKAFGEGLESLAETDINRELFKGNVRKTLEKYGVQIVKKSPIDKGTRVLRNVEFDDPKNIQKASELINRLSKVNLNGKDIRKLADDIESSAYKIATSDERLAFNAFVRDLSDSLTEAISGSTSKLGDINKAFSQEMQLAEGIEKIFGKVKFKNAKEILTVSQRLESLFKQKGLAPEITDQFLDRIGIQPSEFRAGEAVRQIGELTEQSNTIGTNPFEIIRSFTSAVVPPTAVRSLAIQTGIAKEVIQEMAEKLSPTARAVFARFLIGDPGPDVNNDYGNK